MKKLAFVTLLALGLAGCSGGAEPNPAPHGPPFCTTTAPGVTNCDPNVLNKVPGVNAPPVKK